MTDEEKVMNILKAEETVKVNSEQVKITCEDCKYLNPHTQTFCCKCGFNLVNSFIIESLKKKRLKNEKKNQL